MKKMTLALMMLLGVSAYAGQIALPVEHVALPELQGDHLVCVWDETANDWYTGFASYDHNGSLSFQVPSWGKWYWVGLWDTTNGQYVFGKWIGHFMSN